MKNIKTICSVAIILGLVLSLPAISAEKNASPVQKTSSQLDKYAAGAKTQSKIGVIDVRYVVASSKEVEKIKKQQEKKKKAFVSYIKTSVAKMNKEKDINKKAEMKKQFDLDLTAKKEAMDKEYADKLMKINNDMNAKVAKIAKQKGYDLVITNDGTYYGGDDLTKDLMKLVK